MQAQPPRILIVVSRRFNGHEFWTALGVLKENGIKFDVVASDKLIMDELTFKPVRIKLQFSECTPELIDSYDGLMVISGNPKDTESHWHHDLVQEWVVRANNRNIPIAGICCSAPTVRKAARGKRVSFFPLVRSRILLEEAGAICTTVAVSVDQNLVTAEHEMATQMWAECFCKLMRGEDADPKLQDSGYVPRGRKKKPIPEIARLQAQPPVHKKAK
jgi:Putative intracellular protease/amidase